MALIDKINDGFIQLVTLLKGKVDKTATIGIANGGTGATTLAGAQTALGIVDNSSILPLLPKKISSAQKWYRSGLRHGADYPYPYIGSTFIANNGFQYFVPFTALEDTTIKSLEVWCSTAQSNASVSLGIYASDRSNDLSNPLFTSNKIDCGTKGAKSAPCNVQITKGMVYWLSSMVIGTPSFHRNATDSLFPIKGTATAAQSAVIGYYTTGNTSMAQSAPTNTVDMSVSVPRVLFIVA